MPLVDVPDTLITVYVEMTTPEQFKPAFIDAPHARIEQLGRVDVPFYRFLYKAVGDAVRWRDRNFVSDDALAQALAAAQVFVLYVQGVPAGYAELAREGESVEVAFFGLRPEFHGVGFGKHLLSYAVQKAWEMAGVQRVWLHTCNLDSPHALENYLKRGFRFYKEEREAMPERYKS